MAEGLRLLSQENAERDIALASCLGIHRLSRVQQGTVHRYTPAEKAIPPPQLILVPLSIQLPSCPLKWANVESTIYLSIGGCQLLL